MTVVANSSTGFDAHGYATRESGQRRDYLGLLVRLGTTENEQGSLSSEWVLYLPHDAVIDGGDYVEVEGQRFEVDGAPYRLPDHHVEAQLFQRG